MVDTMIYAGQRQEVGDELYANLHLQFTKTTAMTGTGVKVSKYF